MVSDPFDLVMLYVIMLIAIVALCFVLNRFEHRLSKLAKELDNLSEELKELG